MTPDIWTVPDFMPADDCQAMIAWAEDLGFIDATITTQDGTVRDEQTRNNDRVVIDDHELAASLWATARGHVPYFMQGCQAIGLNERFRFYRYERGQQFRGHVDAPFVRANGEHSLLTFMVYLNDGFGGGETSFPNRIVKPERGSALIFHHNIFHEGRPVLDGRKYVLRSDVMFNPVGRLSG
jgi:predicted 2-oxoglutarate/Fe(II)-dependent dioxygenase YbiX